MKILVRFPLFRAFQTHLSFSDYHCEDWEFKCTSFRNSSFNDYSYSYYDNGEDEENKCVGSWYLCNGYDQCDDGSDEQKEFCG